MYYFAVMHQLSCGHRLHRVMVNSSLPCLLWRRCGVSRHLWQMGQPTWRMTQLIQAFQRRTLSTLWDIHIFQPLQILNNMHNQVKKIEFIFLVHVSNSTQCKGHVVRKNVRITVLKYLWGLILHLQYVHVFSSFNLECNLECYSCNFGHL